MGSQTTHSQYSFESKSFPIVVVCDGLRSPANVGGLFRICEAFGVERILFCNASIDLGSARMKKTARTTETMVPFAIYEETHAALESLKEDGYHIIALEITDSSQPMESIKWQGAHQKYALVLGNEAHGIAANNLALADTIVHITMYGTNSSLNVVQACGIALYTLTNSFDG